MSMLQEFKEFAVKGNVIDLAVGIIIGGAFGRIVDSQVKDVVMPVVNAILGGAVDFTNKYYSTPARLAMKVGTVLNDPLADLKGKKIGVQRASIYDRYATAVFAPAGAEVVRYSSQNEIFLDLTAGRVDATLADVVNIDDGFLKTDAGKGFALVGPDYTEAKYFGDGVGIAVRKGDKAMAERFNKAIAAIRANGKYQEVQNKYFQFNVYGE